MDVLPAHTPAHPPAQQEVAAMRRIRKLLERLRLPLPAFA